MTAALSYVGWPYKEFGRDRRGIDCWGVVRLWLREQAGIVVEARDGSDDPAELLAAARRSGDWEKVEGPPRLHDLVLMFRPVAGLDFKPWHVGVMATAKLVLHIAEDGRSRCDHFQSPVIQSRIEGVYRHKQLSD